MCLVKNIVFILGLHSTFAKYCKESIYRMDGFTNNICPVKESCKTRIPSLNLESSAKEIIEEGNKRVENRNSEDYIKAAFAYETAGDFKQAMELYNMALTLNSSAEGIRKRLNMCTFKNSLNEISSKDLYRSVSECAETFLRETNRDRRTITKEMIEEVEEKLKNQVSYLGLIVKGHLNRADDKFKEAGELFQKASEMNEGNNAEAFYNLAMLKIWGNLEKSSITETPVVLLKKAAHQKHGGNVGVAESQFVLGLYLQEAKKDVKNARSWYEKSAREGNGLAANNLGIIFSEGNVKMRNIEAAVKYWITAAYSKHKVVPAMESLAKYYLATYDFEMAIKWHSKAVRHGSILLSPKNATFKSDVDELALIRTNWKMHMSEGSRSKPSDNTDTAKLVKMGLEYQTIKVINYHFKYFKDGRAKVTPVKYKSAPDPNMTTLTYL